MTEAAPQVDVIVGGLYGDEGKGKVVSLLGPKYDYVLRVNASTNASHAARIGGSIHITKQLPTVFHPDRTKLVIAPGALLNLGALKDELAARPDLAQLRGKISIASSITLLIAPYIEAARAKVFNSRFGSTNQGTGMAVVARTERHGLKLYDLENAQRGGSPDKLADLVRFTCEQSDATFFSDKNDGYYLEVSRQLLDDYRAIRGMVGDFSVDYTQFLHSLQPGSSILIEGCNGILLDNIHGMTPYVTSASTCINALLNGANLSPYWLRNAFITVPAYFCCLNRRPFPTEMPADASSSIYRHNDEIDSAEGMQRRLGWFDLPALKKALAGHAGCQLILTKADIMQDLATVRVCTAYRSRSDATVEYRVMPDNTAEVEDVEPVYRDFEGWRSGLDSATSYAELPAALRELISFIEMETKLPVVMIGTGRGAEEMVMKGAQP